MRIILIISTLLFTLQATHAQPPATDIYVFDLAITKDKAQASKPVNINVHKGYDNQPFFHPDKPLLYYVSANDEERTDIFVFDYEKQQTRQLTNTPEKEFSPTVTPDGKYISCIIQRDNGQQDLGKYPIDGGEPEVIINELIVGYHTWIDSDNVILFVLGEPNTLVQYTLSTKKQVRLADNPGRSIHSVPGTGNVFYVDKKNEPWQIMAVGSAAPLHAVVAPQREDIAFTPKGEVFMSDGTKIYFLRTIKVTDDWKEILLATHPAIKGVSRIAVNRTGNKLAVVVNE